MTFAEFALLVLATQRLIFIWLFEAIAAPLRTRLQRRGGWLGYLAGCRFCISVWAGAAMVACWYGVPYGWVVVFALGLSGGALTLETSMTFLEAMTVNRRRA